MELREFALERYFARWEFDTEHNLCASDVEGLALSELLALADEDSLVRWNDLHLGYTPPAGSPDLRAEIAALYTGVDADEIYTSTGAEEAIFIIMRALLTRGDHAIVVTPAYQALYDVARGIGVEVSEVALSESEGWYLDPQRIRGAVTPRTKMIVLNAPHSPTGAHPDEATMREITAIAEEAGARLVVDEVYRFLEHDPDTRLPSGVELSPSAVTVGVMSKAFGLAGLRLGWIASHDPEVISRFGHLRDYVSICNAAPSEVLALIGLRAREALIARAMDMIRPNLALVDAAIEERDYLRWVRPVAGSVGFPELVATESVDLFAEDLAKQAGVLILPGSVFDVATNHFRVGLGRRDVPDSLARFLDFADARFG